MTLSYNGRRSDRAPHCIPFPRFLALLAIALVVGSIGIRPAGAQVEGATVRGQVASPEGPRAGVPVLAIHVATGQVRRATTGDDGRYVMVGLRPGEYEVAVGADAEPERLTLRVGQTATIDFEVETAAGPEEGIEEIVVTGTEVELFEGGAVGTSVTPELIQRLPQINRNFLSFAELAPGVQFVQNNDGSSFIRGGAQHQRAVNVFIDGVSQKDYVLKGGVTGQDSSKGNPFPQSAIAEYKVLTQNYKAEYEHVASVAISAVTASGTNEFHGSAFIDFTNEDLRAETPLEKIEGKQVASEQQQYGLNVSGPIIEEELFFLLAFEAKDNEVPVDVIPGAGFTTDTLPPEFAELTGTEVQDFQEDLFFGKIDWNVSEAQQVEVSLKYRDESAIQGFEGISAQPFATSVDQEDTRFLIEHTYIADNWQNEVRLTWEDSVWSPNPLNDGIGTTIENAAGQGILRTGAGENFQEKGQEGWGIQDDFTLLDLEWFGGHTVKAGVSYKRITLKSLQQLPANPQFFWNIEFNGPGTFEQVQPYKLEFGQPLTPASGAIESENNQYGIYIQDDWYVNDRLTLNIGVRWDYEETPVYKDRVTPAAQVAALQSWPSINNDTVNYDIDNWISAGDNRDYDSDNIAPRFGFSYDIGNAHTVYGGYGRSYDRNLFDVVQLETTNATFGRGTIFFQGDPNHPCAGPSCIPWDPAFLTPEGLEGLIAGATAQGGFSQIFLLPNDLETPYSDQYSIGLRSAWGDWETDIAYSHVESENGFVWLLGNRLPDGLFFEPGAIWGAPFGFPPPGFGNLLLGVNGARTEADSIYLQIERPHIDNWGVSLAYTWTDAQENRKFDENFALDYPSLAGYGFQDAIDLAEHRIVVTGTYDMPWDVLFAAQFSAHTGLTRQLTNCLAGPDQCVFGRVDPDDGDFRQLDISFEKRFGLGILPEDSTFRVRLDVINVFNRRNWDSFDLFPGNLADGPNPNFGAHQDGVSATRTAKLTVGFDW